MNIAFGGIESYMGNIQRKREVLDKYFNMSKVILFDPKRFPGPRFEEEKPNWKMKRAESIRKEEERVILGTWITGMIGVGIAALHLAA